MPKGVHFIDDDTDEDNSDSDSLLPGSPSPVFKTTVKKPNKIAPWMPQRASGSDFDLFSPSPPPKRLKASTVVACKSPREKSLLKLKQIRQEKREREEARKKQNASSANSPVSNGGSHRTREGVEKLGASHEKRKVAQERCIVNGALEVDETTEHSVSRRGRRRVLELDSSSSDSDDFDVEPPAWKMRAQRYKQAHSTSQCPAVPQPSRSQQNTPTNITTTDQTESHIKPEISIIFLSDSDCDDAAADSSPDISDGEFERVINGLEVVRQDRNRRRNLFPVQNAPRTVTSTATCVEVPSSAAPPSAGGAVPSSATSRHKKNGTGHKGSRGRRTQAREVMTQMQKDEEMARKLQEDLDRQYAMTLESRASPSPHPRQPTASHPGRRSMGRCGEHADMKTRIDRLTDWEWQVHVALVQGADAPPVPSGDSRQSPDEAIDTILLGYLFMNPSAIDQRPIANNQLPQAHLPGTAGVNELLPITLDEINDGPRTRTRARTGRGRGARTSTRRRNRATTRFDAMIETRLGLLELENMLLGAVWLPRGRADGLNATFADGDDYEALLALDNQLEHVGLSAEQISRLPVTTFTEGSASATGDGARCHVCMCDYEDGDRLRLLTCFHSFHCDCIDQWIKDNPTCPVCRMEVQV